MKHYKRENIGSHLIYSQFRTLEGIELLKTVLEVNGFERFSIVKNDLGLWELGKMDQKNLNSYFIRVQKLRKKILKTYLMAIGNPQK